MSVAKVERKARGNESPRRKHYDYKVRWRTPEGKQPALVVGNHADAVMLDERMKLAPAPSAKAARAWLASQIGDGGGAYPIGAARGAGIITSAAPTIGVLVEKHLARPGLSDRTRDSYRNLARKLEPVAFAPVDEVTVDEVVSLFRDLERAGAAPTVQRTVRVLLFAALRRGGVDLYPFRDALSAMQTERRVKPVYLNDAQIGALLRTCRDGYPELYAPVRVTLDLATRFGETFGLTPEYVNLDSGYVLIEQQMNARGSTITSGLELVRLKTKTSRRRLPISPDLVKVLEPHVVGARPDLPIFYRPPFTFWPRSTWLYWWKKLVHDTPEVPDRMRYHDLRHTAVQRWRNNGVDLGTASRMLGHSTPVITEITYGEWNTHADDVMRSVQLRDADLGTSLGHYSPEDTLDGYDGEDPLDEWQREAEGRSVARIDAQRSS